MQFLSISVVIDLHKMLIAQFGGGSMACAIKDYWNQLLLIPPYYIPFRENEISI